MTRSMIHDIKGREAECSQCGKTAQTDPGNMPFYRFCGTNSEWADICHCGSSRAAHVPIHPITGRPGVTDHEHEPRGARNRDLYYCGCRGWE